MSADPIQLANFVSWGATGLGLAMWLYSWFGPGDVLRKRRLMDAAMVVIFAAILLRVLVKTAPLNPFDWFLAVVSPLFIAAALYRLSITRNRP